MADNKKNTKVEASAEDTVKVEKYSATPIVEANWEELKEKYALASIPETLVGVYSFALADEGENFMLVPNALFNEDGLATLDGGLVEVQLKK